MYRLDVCYHHLHTVMTVSRPSAIGAYIHNNNVVIDTVILLSE